MTFEHGPRANYKPSWYHHFLFSDLLDVIKSLWQNFKTEADDKLFSNSSRKSDLPSREKYFWCILYERQAVVNVINIFSVGSRFI